jgi:hypothetical protein
MKNIPLISNLQELILFLQKEDNSYSVFILERIHRDSSFFRDVRTQKHHIIPSHCGGPDHAWNLIKLTIEEHAMAHQLLYENYNYMADLGASYMIRGQVEKGWEAIRMAAVNTMREKGTGRFSSELQRQLGSRPKKQRACYARNPYVLAALERGFTLEYCTFPCPSGEQFVIFGPCECSSLVAVVEKLMQHPQMASLRQNWNTYPKKEKHYAITALTRSLTGHVDKKTGKSVFTFFGWRLLGINISID